jgi:hypothetical protein
MKNKNVSAVKLCTLRFIIIICQFLSIVKQEKKIGEKSYLKKKNEAFESILMMVEFFVCCRTILLYLVFAQLFLMGRLDPE